MIKIADTSFKNDELTTSVYIKPKYRHQCFYYRSSHPEHIERPIVYSQTLSVSRLCSFKEDFEDHSEQIILFSERGYPDKIIENKMDKVTFGQRRSKTKSATGVPFFVTYYLRLRALGKIIHENLLYMNDEVKDNFTL